MKALKIIYCTLIVGIYGAFCYAMYRMKKNYIEENINN